MKGLNAIQLSPVSKVKEIIFRFNCIKLNIKILKVVFICSLSISIYVQGVQSQDESEKADYDPNTALSNTSFLKQLEQFKEGLIETNKLTQIMQCELNNVEEISKDDFNYFKRPEIPEEDRFSETIPWSPNRNLISLDDSKLLFKLVSPQEDWCKSKMFEILTLNDNQNLSRIETNSTSNMSNKSTNNLTNIKSTPQQDVKLHPNGTLTWKALSGDQRISQSREFCMVKLSSGGLRFKTCLPPCTLKKPCVRKCCEENEVMDSSGHNCITSNPPWTPLFYREANHRATNPKAYTLRPGLPTCKPTYLIQSNVDKKYPNLLFNGTLIIVSYSSSTDPPKLTLIHPGEFCIDGIKGSDEDSSNKSIASYGGSEWNQIIIACSPIKPQIPFWIPPLYAFFNHTAALFLFITALVYLILWTHQNIHGWLQFSYAVSLFFAYNFLAIVQIWSQQIYNLSQNLCAYLGGLIHFTFLSAFFWLTSMNFDVWWRFSGQRSLRRIQTKPYRESVKKFLLFASFSLGFPILISGITVSLDLYYKGKEDQAPFRLPRFGAKKCYFENKLAQLLYLYGPVGVLLIINLVFFVSTVINLRKHHSNTELARSHSTVEDKKGVRLIAKLFIVMGVLWISEFISWAANMTFPKSENLLIWVFMPTDILNSLQGIAIFVIFICKPNVWNQLKNKIRLFVVNKNSGSISISRANSTTIQNHGGRISDSNGLVPKLISTTNFEK